MWTSLRTAAWLGWQIESNWASPSLFALYSIIKPLTSAAILVVMFGIITQGELRVAGLHVHVSSATRSTCTSAPLWRAWRCAVIDDRERFRMLKSMYVAPVSIPMYLIGRGFARFLTTSLSVLVTIGAGMVFLHLQLTLGEVRWVLFVVALGIGVAMLAMMGLVLASVVLTIAHGSWLVGEAVAGALFLFCGAVFPLDALPAWLRPVGYLMPVTYWLELVRRALLARVAHQYPSLAGIGDGELVVLVVAMTAALGVMASAMFRHCDLIARERGLIDRTTNY